MIEKFIESEANAKFKRWKKLARDARAVRKERATLMEGIHLMQVALESGCRVNAVLIDADRASREAANSPLSSAGRAAQTFLRSRPPSTTSFRPSSTGSASCARRPFRPRPPTTPGSPPTRSISTVCRTRATRAR